MPPEPTRILHLEDSPLDAELARAMLERDDIPCAVDHVQTGPAFEEALHALPYGLIMADYHVPGYDGTHALDLARELAPNVPFLYVSGRMGEEAAIESLKRGATDYVLKTRMERLGPAVRRALDEARDRAEAAAAARRLRESEARFRALADSLPQMVWVTRSDGYHEYFNRRWYDYTGLEPEPGNGYSWGQPLHPDDRDRTAQAWERAFTSGEPYEVEYRFRGVDGQYRWFLGRALPVLGDDGRVERWFGTCTDIEDKKQAEEATRRRAAQLRDLAAAAARIHAARDVDSVVGVVTEEARVLLGAHRASTVLRADPDWPATSRASSDGDAEADGTPPRGDVLTIPLLGRGGALIGSLEVRSQEEAAFSDDDRAILAQLSQLASVAVENARLYQSLRDDDRRKNEFLAMLAHELRNPLASIATAAAVTGEGDEADAAWGLEVIGRQVRHLTRLIDDLLDVARITRGKIELKTRPVDASAVVATAVETVRPLIDGRMHQLSVRAEPDLWVTADPVRLEQIVINLLSNAAKYTERGGHVELEARRDGDGIVLSIRDNGVGIPPESLPRMFELFEQGDRALARSEGGLGIGLTLVKRLTEMHGGRITAASGGLGRGSEFSVRLPAVARPSSDPSQGCQDGASPEPMRPLRVLVVDDSLDTLRGMERLLKMDGHEILTAQDGPSALSIAVENCPDVILLDIGLPGMDGYQVAERLRGNDALKSSMLVALSGYGQREDRERSRQAGFDDHLVKPVHPDDIREYVRNAGHLVKVAGT